MKNTTTSAPRPLIIAEGETVDPLATFDTVKVTTAQLRPGMILVDSVLGTPAAALDHRIGSVGHGVIAWLVEDLDRGGWVRTTFAVSKIANVSVAAA